MQLKFDNKDRRRYNGIRVGDQVIHHFRQTSIAGKENSPGQVVELGGSDNNCVFVHWKGDRTAMAEVAEWLKIIAKVEDLKGAQLQLQSAGMLIVDENYISLTGKKIIHCSLFELIVKNLLSDGIHPQSLEKPDGEKYLAYTIDQDGRYYGIKQPVLK